MMRRLFALVGILLWASFPAQTQPVGMPPTATTTMAVNAVDFPAGPYLLRGAGLTGAADSSLGTASFWYKFDGGNGTSQAVVNANNGNFELSRNVSNKWHLQAFNSTGVNGFNWETTSTYTADGNWHIVNWSWSTNFAVGSRIVNFYIDGVQDVGAFSFDVGVGYTVDYNTSVTNWGVAARTAGTFLFNGCLAESWIAPAQYLDFTVSGNRALFSSGGKPVSLGATGNLPTGTAPLIYLPNPAATVNINAGTGGNFATTGSPAVCATHP